MKLKIFACLFAASAMFSLNAVTIVNNTSKVARIQSFIGLDDAGESKYYDKKMICIQPGDHYDTAQLDPKILQVTVGFSIKKGMSVLFDDIDSLSQGTVTFSDDTIDGQIAQFWS